jgi:crotonobetainyl-CoA hydratase
MTEHMSSDPVLFERDGHIAVIILNRPDSLNSVNASLATGLGTALEELANDPLLRVGVITGNGRAFCAGMDLKAFAAGESVDPIGHPEWGFGGIVEHFVDKPLIAAVNGAAYGGGAEIALACDLIVADEEARFALPEVTRGLFAAAGGVIRLSRQLPQKVALELILTGRPLTARDAAGWGLVNRVAPAGTSLEVALALAHEIAANAPLGVQASKRLVHETATLSSWDHDTWALNQKEMDAVFSSEDAHEGAVAFAEKRSPVWRAK